MIKMAAACIALGASEGIEGRIECESISSHYQSYKIVSMPSLVAAW